MPSTPYSVRSGYMKPSPTPSDTSSENSSTLTPPPDEIKPTSSTLAAPAVLSSEGPAPSGNSSSGVEMSRSGGPLARYHAENTSGVRSAGSRVTFADILGVQGLDDPPALDWCRRCVRLIGRDPSAAGPGFVCTRHIHKPCRYCTDITHQGCQEIFPQWRSLAENVIYWFRRLSTVPEEDIPATRATLKQHFLAFNSAAQDGKLPGGQRPSRARRTCGTASRAAPRAPSCDERSRAASRERSRSPRPSGSAHHQNTPDPTSPTQLTERRLEEAPAQHTQHHHHHHHQQQQQRAVSARDYRQRSPSLVSHLHQPCMPSGGSYDNYGEVGRVVEKIIEQAQAERVEGPSLSSQVTLWGFAREFYRKYHSA